ncbi:MAG: PilN domain-containing protein [Clostridiales bacterium]|nr:PilN domain-containing protein [Eubacteriales bacterium]MDH7565253.1 PilN domain-containing protein [Clostridiales bacterium]
MKDLNLIPKSYILEKKKAAKRVYMAVGAAAACVLLLVMIGGPLGLKYSLKAQRDSLEAKIMATDNYVAMENQFNRINNMYKMREEEGKKLSRYGIDVPAIIDSIEKATPEKLFFTNLSVRTDNNGSVLVTLTGISSSMEDIASFVNKIRTDGCFGSVTIGAVNKEAAASAQYDFNISMSGYRKKDGAKQN